MILNSTNNKLLSIEGNLKNNIILKSITLALVLTSICLLYLGNQLFFNGESLIDPGNIPLLNSFRLGSGLVVPSLVKLFLIAAVLSGCAALLLRYLKEWSGRLRLIIYYLSIGSSILGFVVTSIFQYLLAFHGVQYA